MEGNPEPHVEPDQEHPTEQEPQVVVGRNSKRWNFTMRQNIVFVLIFAAIGGYFLFITFAAPPKKPTTQTPTPLSFTQSWQARYTDGRGLSGGCFGVDDRADWQGSGTLAAGASYTFIPTDPTCSTSELPMIAMHVSWSGSTQVKLETTNPFASALISSANNLHETAPIAADANGNQQANLCMWVDGMETVYDQGLVSRSVSPLTQNYHLPWSMTITNTGSQTATISASGYEANGWAMNIYPGCKRADGDGDHWNDALEMLTQDLTYYASGAADAYANYQGSNYMAASGSSVPNDEIDFSPADFNDDGVIDQADINTVTAHLGQGDGVSVDQIGPNQGTPGYIYNETQLWRRYDIDGDGYVTQHDIDWVKALVGQAIPLTSDLLNPWAIIHVPDKIPANYAGYPLNAYAVDNDILTHVDFLVTVGGKQQQICSVWGANAPSFVPSTANDQFSCNWNTPRSAGQSVVVTVKAYDNAAHSYAASKTVTTQ